MAVRKTHSRDSDSPSAGGTIIPYNCHSRSTLILWCISSGTGSCPLARQMCTDRLPEPKTLIADVGGSGVLRALTAPASGSQALVDCGPGFHLASPTSWREKSESATLKVKSRDRPVGTCGVPISCSADCVLAHSKGTERNIDGCCLIRRKGEEQEEGFPGNSEIHKQREAVPTLKT